MRVRFLILGADVPAPLLHTLFFDGAVLQCDRTIPIWAVWFARSNFPRGDIYNGAALPTALHRSDSW